MQSLIYQMSSFRIFDLEMSDFKYFKEKFQISQSYCVNAISVHHLSLRFRDLWFWLVMSGHACSRLHWCWWWMSETKCGGDKFGMLVTSHVINITFWRIIMMVTDPFISDSNVEWAWKLYFVMTRKVDHEFCSQGFDLEIFVLEIQKSMNFGLSGFQYLILASTSVSLWEIEFDLLLLNPSWALTVIWSISKIFLWTFL